MTNILSETSKKIDKKKFIKDSVVKTHHQMTKKMVFQTFWLKKEFFFKSNRQKRKVSIKK